MDFELSERQELLKKTAYDFAVNEIEPIAVDCDKEEKYPKHIWEKACKAGIGGVIIPKKYGGPGLGVLEWILVTEQLSRVDLGVSMAIVPATFGSENILFFGTEAQRKKYLPLLARGQAVSSGAYTEPDAGSDIAGIRTTAIKEENGYVINGNKMFITHGTVCDWMVVLCVTNPNEEERYKRQSMVVVESDRAGVNVSRLRGKMGLRASDTTEVSFADVHVPFDNLVGEEGKGFRQLMHFFNVTRTLVAAQGVGIAQGALDKTLSYVREKKVNGQPVAEKQIVQFHLAEMATRIEVSRSITYRAAWIIDQGRADPSLSAMAKYFSGESAVWVCGKALEIHGRHSPAALYENYDIQRFYRDVKILEIYEGAKEVEKITIARRLL